ncbi:MAG: OmpA family protein [Alphaproteobacteria bacterium]|nr:OmpA family protein [Alphaproteobacteria bacterium]
MRLSASRLALLAVLGSAAIALTACAEVSDMFGGSADETVATGSPFTQGLLTAYTDLANQADALPSEEGGLFSTLTLGAFDSESPKDMLKRAFTAKADLAGSGQEPAIEAAPSPAIAPVHDRLATALAAGKDRFPEQAARAQSDYDCWVLFGMVPTAAANAATCKSQLDTSLPNLEVALRPAPPPIPVPPPMTAPAPAPVTTAPVAPVTPPPAQTAPATTNFTVYFDFDSWTLTAEDLTVLTNVINTARTGGQSHITVVGHTDTSGSAAYNQRLSVRRANVVVEALVDMGARRAAIQASGVGETDLAVQTGDNVKEAKNRRTVVDLKP